MRGFHGGRGEGGGFLILFVIFLLALAMAGGCAPSRYTYREDPGVVCYEAGGGLFGGPSLQCIDRAIQAPDGGC